MAQVDKSSLNFHQALFKCREPDLEAGTRADMKAATSTAQDVLIHQLKTFPFPDDNDWERSVGHAIRLLGSGTLAPARLRVAHRG
jgi:hypothetical protein